MRIAIVSGRYIYNGKIPLKAPEILYLFEFDKQTRWCVNTPPPPEAGQDAPVKYIREDCTLRPPPCEKRCEARAFEIEIRRFSRMLGY